MDNEFFYKIYVKFKTPFVTFDLNKSDNLAKYLDLTFMIDGAGKF